MLPVLIFSFCALFSLICCVFLLKTGILAAVLIAFGVFILLHLLYVVFFWLFSLSVPRDRPLEKQNAVCRRGMASLASILNFYAGVHPIITGEEKLPTDSRFLFVCNHRSMFDPIIVVDKLRAANMAFISKPSNMKLPLLSRIAYADGFLAIDRENDRNALKTILTAADYLKRDLCSIAIYPEGTRSRTADLLPFHAGSFKIAQRAKVPIVVASVRGKEKKPGFLFFPRTEIRLDILEVIPAEEVCAVKTPELSEHVRSMILADLEQTGANFPVSDSVRRGEET